MSLTKFDIQEMAKQIMSSLLETATRIDFKPTGTPIVLDPGIWNQSTQQFRNFFKDRSSEEQALLLGAFANYLKKRGKYERLVSYVLAKTVAPGILIPLITNPKTPTDFFKTLQYMVMQKDDTPQQFIRSGVMDYVKHMVDHHEGIQLMASLAHRPEVATFLLQQNNYLWTLTDVHLETMPNWINLVRLLNTIAATADANALLRLFDMGVVIRVLQAIETYLICHDEFLTYASLFLLNLLAFPGLRDKLIRMNVQPILRSAYNACDHPALYFACLVVDETIGYNESTLSASHHEFLLMIQDNFLYYHGSWLVRETPLMSRIGIMHLLTRLLKMDFSRGLIHNNSMWNSFSSIVAVDGRVHWIERKVALEFIQQLMICNPDIEWIEDQRILAVITPMLQWQQSPPGSIHHQLMQLAMRIGNMIIKRMQPNQAAYFVERLRYIRLTEQVSTPPSASHRQRRNIRILVENELKLFSSTSADEVTTWQRFIPILQRHTDAEKIIIFEEIYRLLRWNDTQQAVICSSFAHGFHNIMGSITNGVNSPEYFKLLELLASPKLNIEIPDVVYQLANTGHEGALYLIARMCSFNEANRVRCLQKLKVVTFPISDLRFFTYWQAMSKVLYSISMSSDVKIVDSALDMIVIPLDNGFLDNANIRSGLNFLAYLPMLFLNASCHGSLVKKLEAIDKKHELERLFWARHDVHPAFHFYTLNFTKPRIKAGAKLSSLQTNFVRQLLDCLDAELPILNPENGKFILAILLSINVSRKVICDDYRSYTLPDLGPLMSNLQPNRKVLFDLIFLSELLYSKKAEEEYYSKIITYDFMSALHNFLMKTRESTGQLRDMSVVVANTCILVQNLVTGGNMKSFMMELVDEYASVLNKIRGVA